MTVSHTHKPVFDEPSLVSAAGLAPVLDLAEQAGLSQSLSTMTVASPNHVVKSRTLIAGMLAGADSIDDLDLLRAGATPSLIGAVRAPSTLGTFLRSFTHGHVLQIAKTNRDLLSRLPTMVPDGQGPIMVEMDDTIRGVHGHHKQAAAFGYSGVRGLNALLVTASTDQSAPVVLESQLRRGNIRSGDHANWHLARGLSTISRLAPGRQVLIRADAAFCQRVNITAAEQAGAWWSYTIPQWKTVTAAISSIAEDRWEPIFYPQAIYDDESGQWISDAEVAEVASFTAFASRPKAERVNCRLVVRRVKVKPDSQEALFATWRYHAFITNSDFNTVEADRRHRGHAIVEQVIAELKQGPLAHLPSGKFVANQAWLAFAIIAFNIARAAARAAGMGLVRWQTLLRKIIAISARLASTGRRLIIHLPKSWPWQAQWSRLWAAASSP
ncbi:IS1380 family transposase [Brevibacterium spongiae]|uniref:IS1380 family transposase n=1 Tax=Brevibacterium spongiae TaxID=2909672 RepID=A0ABY5SPR7_9MICO|nr:IS1380 family transposase [Brevibacterium spongiae]UVI36572.1 IS1380 family transposase [Brevibacterium spongiae]UVI36573.1 IS1380 family transposase [Brevibacterium spongiae]